MAIGNQVKISSDGLRTIGDSSKETIAVSAYDAPENATAGSSAATDIWSLGMTTLEVLTRRLPPQEAVAQDRAFLPGELIAPFDLIVRRCLQIDPGQRCSLSEVARSLQPSVAAEPAAARPLSPPQPVRAGETRTRFVAWVWGAGLAVVAIVAVLLARTALDRRSPASSVTASPSEELGAPAQTPVPAVPEPTPVSEPPSAPVQAPVAGTPEPAPKVSPAKASGGDDDVIQRIVPKVPPRAAASIRGKVTVRVRARVDDSGSVTEIVLVSPGPSAYFAGLAKRAAQDWKFVPAQEHDRKTLREYLLQFQFKPKDVDVSLMAATRR
jgi:TonB family protein